MTQSPTDGGRLLPDFWMLPPEPPLGTAVVPADRAAHDEHHRRIHAYRRVMADGPGPNWMPIEATGLPHGGLLDFEQVLGRCAWHIVRVDGGDFAVDLAARAAWVEFGTIPAAEADKSWGQLPEYARQNWRKVAGAVAAVWSTHGPQALPQPDFYPADPERAEEVERVRQRAVRLLKLAHDTPMEEVVAAFNAQVREMNRALAPLMSMFGDVEDGFPTRQVRDWMERLNAGDTVMVRGLAGDTGQEVLRGTLLGWTDEPQLAIKVAPGTTVRWAAGLVEEIEPDVEVPGMRLVRMAQEPTTETILADGRSVTEVSTDHPVPRGTGILYQRDQSPTLTDADGAVVERLGENGSRS